MCRSQTEERGSTRGMRPDRQTDGQIEGGDHRSAPAPQVALLVPVQRPKPVVEADQTGLRDCGREGRRVTDARATREVAGSRALHGGPGCQLEVGGGVTRPRGAIPRETKGPNPTPSIPARGHLGAPEPENPGPPQTWRGGAGAPRPFTPTLRSPLRSPGLPHPSTRLSSGPHWSSRPQGPPPRSQPVSRRMSSESGIRAAAELWEPMAALQPDPGDLCSRPGAAALWPPGPKATGLAGSQTPEPQRSSPPTRDPGE